MFEVKRHELFKDTDKILYNIMLLLEEQNRLLTAASAGDKSLPQVASETKSIQCKHCGGTHENKGQIMACAKKRKKEGKTNGSA